MRGILLPVALVLAAGCAAAGISHVPAEIPPPAAASAAAALPPVPAGALTVDDAVRLALARNPDLGAARARIEAALAGIEAARSGSWPRVSVDASYLRADAPSAYLVKTIDAHAFVPGTDFNDPGPFSNLEWGGTVRWNLWDGGRTRLAKRSAEAGEVMAREGASGVRNALVAGVVSAWLDVRGSEEVLSSDDASVRTVESQVAETRVRVEGGAALRSDLLSLEVRLAEAREARLRTDLGRRLALANLRRLLALPAGETLALAADAFQGAGPMPPDLGAALDEALTRRPEAAVARGAAARARLEEESARRSFLPRLDAEARSYADDGDGSADFGRANWTVGAVLTFDILDRGARSAGVHRARAAVREASEADRAVLQGISVEVESAWLRLEEARARRGVTRRSVEAAEESYGLVEEQYRGGVATVTRWLEAESARTRARATEVGSRLDEERAAVELSRAMGRLAAPGAPPEGEAQ